LPTGISSDHLIGGQKDLTKNQEMKKLKGVIMKIYNLF
jgi:hypothetical protein